MTKHYILNLVCVCVCNIECIISIYTVCVCVFSRKSGKEIKKGKACYFPVNSIKYNHVCPGKRSMCNVTGDMLIR